MTFVSQKETVEHRIASHRSATDEANDSGEKPQNRERKWMWLSKFERKKKRRRAAKRSVAIT
jgi:hypothetical protein